MKSAQYSAPALPDLHFDAGRMLYIFAHELRGPLAPIRYAAASLSLRNPVGTPERKAVDMIERQLSSIEGLIENVLDSARMQHSLSSAARARVNLVDAVAEAVDAVTPYVAERKHVINFELQSNPIYVDADAGQLGQIVRNLVTNAAKYTDRGGRIEVRTTVSDDMAQICVSDSGIGLTPAELASIFDLYAQAGQAGSARSAGGLGIGLYVVRQLVMAHGGTIVASSQGANRGSQFTVSLSLSEVGI